MSRHIDHDASERGARETERVSSRELPRADSQGDQVRPTPANAEGRSAAASRIHSRSDERTEPNKARAEVSDRTEARRERQPVLVRGRTCVISPAERALLHDIGRFRTVAIEDLRNHLYSGATTQMRHDLRSLIEQDLVKRRSVWLNKGQGQLSVVVLTKAGKDLLEDSRRDFTQRVYAGFVKPAEVAHDAAIYRMFHKEAGRIQKAGGIIRRVVLDYEFKREIYAPLAKVRHLPPLEYAKHQAQVAQENGLKVITGKIPLPDLRIEYETAQGDLTRVDLELATHHYHGSHLRMKAEAGFKLYTANGEFSKSSAPQLEPELTAEIFSL